VLSVVKFFGMSTVHVKFFGMSTVHVLIDLHWVRALTVPMHLSLIDGPFVLHNDISSGQHCPFTKVPDGAQN